MDTDIWLFYAVNHGWKSGFLDAIMPVITSTSTWRPIYAVALVTLLVLGVREFRQSKSTRYFRWFGALVVSVAVLDPLSHHFLKETIARQRPYLVLGDVYKLVESGGGSFPSNHAVNNAAAAVVNTVFLPRLAWLWWTIAVVVSISRVYVGVHYPSDVVAGFLIGCCVGYGFARLFTMADRRSNAHQEVSPRHDVR